MGDKTLATSSVPWFLWFFRNAILGCIVAEFGKKTQQLQRYYH